MKKKILALVLAGLTVVSLAACSGDASTDSTSSGNDSKAETNTDTASESESDIKTSAAAADGTLKTIESGKLIVATNAEFPPYEYHEGDKIVGIDMEIADAIAKKMGLQMEIEDIAFDSVILEVTSGKADIGMAGITATDERRQSVDFTDSYTTAKQLIIVKEDSGVASSKDLEGKTIGVQTGTTGDFMAGDVKDAVVERYQKGMDAVQALSQGKLDAVIIDSEVAKKFVEETTGLKVLDEAFKEEQYAIAVKKGNTEMLKSVNKALSELKADGTVDKIMSKYIKAE